VENEGVDELRGALHEMEITGLKEIILEIGWCRSHCLFFVLQEAKVVEEVTRFRENFQSLRGLGCGKA
jgi:hypothetical protein